MKSVFSKISAALLVMWYSLSVIGFDVHTCNGSDRTFIATVIGGTGCEDIHPGHEESGCMCCHHGPGAHDDSESAGPKMSTEPCCTDDWQMMALTGMRDTEEHRQMVSCTCLHCVPVLTLAAADLHAYVDYVPLTFRICGPGDIILPDVQRTYGIWRI